MEQYQSPQPMNAAGRQDPEAAMAQPAGTIASDSEQPTRTSVAVSLRGVSVRYGEKEREDGGLQAVTDVSASIEAVVSVT